MKKVFIHPTAEVSDRAKIGANTRIWHQAQVRENAVIGRSCILAKGVYVDFGVKIGNNVKIENGVSVFHGVTVEDDVILAPNATFTNDLYPRAFVGSFKVYPTLVRRGAAIGANSTIICGTTIGRYAMVAAGAVVTNDVPDFGLVMGNPARLKAFICPCGKRLEKRRLLGNRVMMSCPACRRRIGIPKNDFALLGPID
ncbi:MAG: acetyltransferase [Candidatus Margulisbacteria bacterium]|jgi:acetyltransferase-like isoleucine patch superfamily enzyme|nr:acetyltransferase [Candidatus Margulisiibacteriota bacterium]